MALSDERYDELNEASAPTWDPVVASSGARILNQVAWLYDAVGDPEIFRERLEELREFMVLKSLEPHAFDVERVPRQPSWSATGKAVLKALEGTEVLHVGDAIDGVEIVFAAAPNQRNLLTLYSDRPFEFGFVADPAFYAEVLNERDGGTG